MVFIFEATEARIRAGIAESEGPRLLIAYDHRTMTAVGVYVEMLDGEPAPVAWHCAGPMPREAVDEWAANLAAGLAAGRGAPDARVIN